MVSLPRVARGAAVLAAVMLLAACTGTASPTPTLTSAPMAENGQLRLQLSGTMSEEFAGEYLAIAKAYVEQSGFSALVLTEGPSSGIAELVAGTADVALSDALTVGAAIAQQQAPLVVIGAVLQQNPYTILSLAEEGNIVQASDLGDTTIGVQPGAEAMVGALLAANDIDADSVTVVAVQNGSSSLVNGDIDGYLTTVTAEPLALTAQGYALASLPLASNGLPFVSHAFTTTDAYLESHREQLKAFLYAEVRGWIDAVRDPAAGAALAVELYGADRGLEPEQSLERAIVRTQQLVVSDETVTNGLLTISAGLRAASIRSLAAAGFAMADEDLFDLSLLAEVYAEHPELAVSGGA